MSHRYNLRSKKTVTFDDPDVVMDVELRTADDSEPKTKKVSKVQKTATKKAAETGAALGKNATQGVAKTVAKGAAAAAAATSGVAKDAIADKAAKVAGKQAAAAAPEGKKQEVQKATETAAKKAIKKVAKKGTGRGKKTVSKKEVTKAGNAAAAGAPPAEAQKVAAAVQKGAEPAAAVKKVARRNLELYRYKPDVEEDDELYILTRYGRAYANWLKKGGTRDGFNDRLVRRYGDKQGNAIMEILTLNRAGESITRRGKRTYQTRGRYPAKAEDYPLRQIIAISGKSSCNAQQVTCRLSRRF